MRSFTTGTAVTEAVADTSLDPDLRRLLAVRARQLEDGIDLGDIAHFHVVEPGDSPADVEAALGFPADVNLVDGVRFGEPDFTPSWEWVQRHDGGWFEAPFVMSDDGFGHVLLIPDQHDTDPRLLALCRDHLTPA